MTILLSRIVPPGQIVAVRAPQAGLGMQHFTGLVRFDDKFRVPTALVTLDLDDALSICDKLNRCLGYDREAWTAMVAASMSAETPEPGDPTEH